MAKARPTSLARAAITSVLTGVYGGGPRRAYREFRGQVVLCAQGGHILRLMQMSCFFFAVMNLVKTRVLGAFIELSADCLSNSPSRREFRRRRNSLLTGLVSVGIIAVSCIRPAAVCWTCRMLSVNQLAKRWAAERQCLVGLLSSE